jgi:hypothetical protein
MGEELNVSYMTIRKVLHEQLLYPYHLQVQFSCPLIFQHQITSVGVLFKEVLGMSLFHHCSLQMRHVLTKTASSIFTTNTSGQKRILSSSPLMCGQELLVIAWLARMFCHFSLHATTTEISPYMISESYWKMHHRQSEHECDTCMMVLWHILAMLSEIYSITPIMTDE